MTRPSFALGVALVAGGALCWSFAGVVTRSDRTRTNIVGRFPTVTGWPPSTRRSISRRVAAPLPSSKVTAAREPDGPCRRVCASRQASTFRRRGASDSGSSASRAATVPPSMACTFQPVRTPAAAAAPFASTSVTMRAPSSSRTSKPGVPLRSFGTSAALSALPGRSRRRPAERMTDTPIVRASVRAAS